MAKLSAFKTDIDKIKTGTWVRPDEDLYGDLEFLTKGIDDSFSDARNARLRKAAQSYGNKIEKLPVATFRKIIADLLLERCLQDVRNLSDENGKPVSFATFSQLIYQEQFKELWDASLEAAAIVGKRHDEAKEDAAKN